jgi:hypothetical protein
VVGPVLFVALVVAATPAEALIQAVVPSHAKLHANSFVATTKKTTKKKRKGNITTTAAGLDLGKAPPVIGASSASVYYFGHLSDSPAVTVGPLATADRYALSPDSRYAAVARAGDAVRKARLEIVATATGKVAHSFELDADGVVVASWSPDSTAVLAGAKSSTDSYTWAVYQVDGTSQALTKDWRWVAPSITEDAGVPPWVRGKSGTTVVECDRCGNRPDSFQLITSKGVPVFLTDGLVLSSADPPRVTSHAGRYDADTGQIVPYSGAYGTPSADSSSGGLGGGMACGRFATLTALTLDDRGFTTQVAYGLYDSDSDKITPVSLKDAPTHCPIASNGGNVVAFESTDGVRVVNLVTGTQTPVAREGYPIGWSKDDSKVLVQGNGTFIVAADGSGGKQASIVVQGFCTVAKTGALITSVAGQNPDGPVDLLYYDIASDSAKPIGNGQFNYSKLCEVSTNSKWVVSDRTVIDLARGHTAIVGFSDRNKASLNVAVHLWGPAFVGEITRPPS